MFCHVATLARARIVGAGLALRVARIPSKKSAPAEQFQRQNEADEQPHYQHAHLRRYIH